MQKKNTSREKQRKEWVKGYGSDTEYFNYDFSRIYDDRSKWSGRKEKYKKGLEDGQQRNNDGLTIGLNSPFASFLLI